MHSSYKPRTREELANKKKTWKKKTCLIPNYFGVKVEEEKKNNKVRLLADNWNLMNHPRKSCQILK